MTTEEADVMQELVKPAIDCECGPCRALVAKAKQLLGQHADDQKATDLAWLVENYDGADGSGIGRTDWEFVALYDTDPEFDPGGVVITGGPGCGVMCDVCYISETVFRFPVATRGDIRRLPAGLLVPKKKGEVE